MINYNVLKEACNDIGVEFTDEIFEKFDLYKDLLKEWNEKVNLTAILDDEEIFKKHFVDSIKIFNFKPLMEAKTLIDIGTGGGFPGIPIKIIKSDIKVTLLDSLNKRITVLNDVVSKLKLKDVELVHGRAEEYLNEKKLRDSFDIVTSRAVANLTTLCELCIPYVKVGGYFVSLKGPNAEEELDQSRNAIGTLGGKFVKIIPIKIEDSELHHNLVIIKKVKESEKKYPRKWKQITGKPIK
nr:16S rRNA (guanine(527)-N(7))-methyltransferase RsmG [Clostridium grantii]